MTSSPTTISPGRPSGWLDEGQVIAGALHYFRVHPEQWADRLARLAAMGLTAVETYVAWNFHEPRPGVRRFDGWHDLPRFITLAADAGLDVIVRPSPYICAEWDAGGIPAWLRERERVALRTMDPRFLSAVSDWFDDLIPRLLPLQRTSGGPIVAMQIENEYGSYADDHEYMRWSRSALLDRGITVPLFTSDGPTDLMVGAGALPGTVEALNFGSRAGEALEYHATRLAGTPFFCGEYWAGWFDHWGEGHHRRDAADAVGPVREILESGGSVNVYMAHGGTNFGLWSGANHADGRLQPTVTSYDSDAAVAEDGALTPKFWAFRELFSSIRGVEPPAPPAAPVMQTPQNLDVVPGSPLLDALAAFAPEQCIAGAPLTFEELEQNAGLVVYESDVALPPGDVRVRVLGLADRATVLVDGVNVGVLDRNEPEASVLLPVSGRTARVSLVVENQGRINYGPLLGEGKGILGGVGIEVDGMFRLTSGWSHRSVDLNELALPEAALDRTSPDDPARSGMSSATVTLTEPADAHLALPGWGKGYVWLNGFLLGRYWEVGPQVTLYAPAPLWRAGVNRIAVLELERSGGTVEIRDAADLGPVEQTGGM